MVVFAGDMNGHVGSSNVGYDGTHGGFGYGSRNADGSMILEFADGLNYSRQNIQHLKLRQQIRQLNCVHTTRQQNCQLWFFR